MGGVLVLDETADSTGERFPLLIGNRVGLNGKDIFNEGLLGVCWYGCRLLLYGVVLWFSGCE